MIALSSNVSAQEGLGIELGINNSKIKTETSNATNVTDSKTGLRAGVTYAIPVTRNLYLKPGLFYSNKGSQGMDNVLGNKKTYLDYLEVPINLGAKFPLMNGNAGSIFVEAGPYLGYAMSGKVKTTDIPIIGNTESKIDFGSEASKMNPFDWGFNFGAGYETPWKVYIKGQYGLGLGNMNNLDNITSTNQGCNVSLGYNF